MINFSTTRNRVCLIDKRNSCHILRGYPGSTGDMDISNHNPKSPKIYEGYMLLFV